MAFRLVGAARGHCRLPECRPAPCRIPACRTPLHSAGPGGLGAGAPPSADAPSARKGQPADCRLQCRVDAAGTGGPVAGHFARARSAGRGRGRGDRRRAARYPSASRLRHGSRRACTGSPSRADLAGRASDGPCLWRPAQRRPVQRDGPGRGRSVKRAARCPRLRGLPRRGGHGPSVAPAARVRHGPVPPALGGAAGCPPAAPGGASCSRTRKPRNSAGCRRSPIG